MADNILMISLIGANLAATAVGVAVGGFALANQWSSAQTLGQHTSSLSTLIDDVRENEKGIISANDSIRQVLRQIQVAQTDVAVIMARAGVPIDSDVSWVSIGKQMVGFPQTAAAEESLKKRDFQAVQVTPAIGGYVLDEMSAQIVRATVEQSIDSPVEPASTSPKNLNSRLGPAIAQ